MLLLVLVWFVVLLVFHWLLATLNEYKSFLFVSYLRRVHSLHASHIPQFHLTATTTSNRLVYIELIAVASNVLSMNSEKFF